VRGDRRLTASLEDLYIPTKVPKSERGAKLPRREDLLQWSEHIQNQNLQHLAELNDTEAGHHLHTDKYLHHFLIQHHCQHFETMIMSLHQKMLSTEPGNPIISNKFEPTPLSRKVNKVPAGHYRVGGQKPIAYDNELPAQQAQLGPYSIALRPVSNAEYLSFMENGGYRNKGFWSSEGWDWLQKTTVDCPEHWRRDSHNDWYGIGLRGAYELNPTDPVSGINYFEATACASFAGGKLPHEYQWETASRLGLIENTGRAWEWCENAFHPYEGFTPFPYDEYSQPWFDNDHYTLRGGSLYTQPDIRRHSFRNFYTPDKRHIFSGLRLVYD